MKTTHNHVKRIGIIGGGQLGRMLAQAALPLGIECTFLENTADCPAASLGPVFDTTPAGIAAFIASADVFTLEFENAQLAHYDTIAAAKPLFPSRAALATAQHRLVEKEMLASLNIPVPAFLAVNNETELATACTQLGLPLVLKTATGGYDGKGQYVIKTAADSHAAWLALGQAGTLIAEQFIRFEREVSIIAVRSQTGEIHTWSLAENHHHQGILSHSIVPAPHSDIIAPQAIEYISKVLNHLHYVGVLTLELFVTEQGLMANEIAPRVHNSGHWSIEGAVCSQFENHIRAVAGLPLGVTDTIKPNVMINIIGKHPAAHDILAIEGAHLHLYNKSERTGRKLGHITLMPTQAAHIAALSTRIANALPEPLALLTGAVKKS